MPGFPVLHQLLEAAQTNVHSVSDAIQLKPFTRVWASNPHGWDSKPATTHSTWFQDLMKLRFLMSRGRKNSARDKVVGEKWIYSDTEAHSRASVGHRRDPMWSQNFAWLVIIGWAIS